MSELMDAIKAELGKRTQKIEELTAELQQARKDLADYKTDIANALGTDLSPSVEHRRERVLALIREGKTLKDVALELDVAISTIKNDIWKCEREGRYPVPLKSEDDEESRRRNRFIWFWRESTINNEEDVAKRLGISVELAKQDCLWLEKNGYIEVDHSDETELSSSPSPQPALPVPIPSPVIKPKPTPPPASMSLLKLNEAEDNEENDGKLSDPKAASTEALRTEVQRQQAGGRGEVELVTTRRRDHSHVAKVDRFGNGQTLSDQTGHVHRVARFLPANVHRHSHDLTIEKPSATQREKSEN